jgi:uncharacterized protein YjbI with pentapeptide repeats
MTTTDQGATGPFARPPRTAGVLDDEERAWADSLDIVDRWASAIGARVRGVALDPAGVRSIEIRDSVLTDVDLSGIRVESISRARLEGCKLTGADISGSPVRDTELVRCVLSMVNFRQSSLDRVVFRECLLDDVDFYGAGLVDVDMTGSVLTDVNVDAARFERVDLHEAGQLGLRGVGRLTGCRIGERQIYELAPALAVASGVDIVVAAVAPE